VILGSRTHEAAPRGHETELAQWQASLRLRFLGPGTEEVVPRGHATELVRLPVYLWRRLLGLGLLVWRRLLGSHSVRLCPGHLGGELLQLA